MIHTLRSKQDFRRWINVHVSLDFIFFAMMNIDVIDAHEQSFVHQMLHQSTWNDTLEVTIFMLHDIVASSLGLTNFNTIILQN